MRCALLLSAIVFAALFCASVLVDGRGRLPQADALAPAAPALDVEDFMLVVHGTKGLKAQIDEGLKTTGTIDDKAWKALQARGNVIVYLTDTVLAKSEPGKGDKAAWKAKVTDYGKLAKALVGSLIDKDVNASKAQLAKISKTCDACHKAHK